jgi:hypothetical protein
MSNPVRPEPDSDPNVGLAVQPETDRRGHVDDSFDKLGLFDVRACAVAAMEFASREMIAGLQNGWKRRRGRHQAAP